MTLCNVSKWKARQHVSYHGHPPDCVDVAVVAVVVVEDPVVVPTVVVVATVAEAEVEDVDDDEAVMEDEDEDDDDEDELAEAEVVVAVVLADVVVVVCPLAKEPHASSATIRDNRKAFILQRSLVGGNPFPLIIAQPFLRYIDL